MVDNSIDTLVSAPARLHLGLHDCGYATRRIFGGVGVIIDGLPTTVAAHPSSNSEVTFEGSLTPSARTIESVDILLSKINSNIGPIKASVYSAAPEHMGLGSKTSLLLAIAQSAFLAYGYKPGENLERIVAITGRGGTSGIGVNGFLGGGLIVDGGHNPSSQERSFRPSSGRQPTRIAPVIARVAMPETWRVQLFFDPEFKSIEGTKEQELFEELMPLPNHEILAAMSATFHSILPSIIEKDIDMLAVGLQDLNGVSMKQREVQLQTRNTREFLRAAWGSGKAAGLSSFGPTVFIISEVDDSPTDANEQMAANFSLQTMGTYSFNNRGADFYDTTIV